LSLIQELQEILIFSKPFLREFIAIWAAKGKVGATDEKSRYRCSSKNST